MKLAESIKRHPYRYAFGSIGVLSLAAAEVTGYVTNRVYDVPENSCVSPMAVSETYVNKNASNLLYAHATGFGPAGVRAAGELPKDAYGVQASFRSPGAAEEAWNEHASDMVNADETGRVALKLAIGPGDVQFGIRVVAPKGSHACNEVPDIDFDYLDRSDYYDSLDRLPWPNPANTAVSAVARVF